MNADSGDGDSHDHQHGHDHTISTDTDAQGTGTERVRLSVPEMDCASCAGKVEHALEGLSGVAEFDTHPTTGTVVVTYDPRETSTHDLVSAIEGAAENAA